MWTNSPIGYHLQGWFGQEFGRMYTRVCAREQCFNGAWLRKKKSGQHFEFCNSDSKSRWLLVATKVLLPFVFCFLSLSAWILIHSGMYSIWTTGCGVASIFSFSFILAQVGDGEAKEECYCHGRAQGLLNVFMAMKFCCLWCARVGAGAGGRYKLHEKDPIFADLHLNTVHLLP